MSAGVRSAESPQPGDPMASRRALSVASVAWRVVLLLGAVVGMYITAPRLITVLSEWNDLTRITWWIYPAMLIAEIVSFACMWALLRVALPNASWFAISISQLAANAVTNVVPAGPAVGATLQHRMLVENGVDSTRSATAMTVIGLIRTGIIFAFPIFSVPAILLGVPVDAGLAEAALLAAGFFVVLFLGGWYLLVADTPVRALGSSIEAVSRRLGRHKTHDGSPQPSLADKMLTQRNEIRAGLESQWRPSLGAAVGNWGLDFLALLLAVYGTGVDPRASLVLLAYVAAKVLALVPITPGGLGFVETGLTGTLVLAGVSLEDAALATLAYRLVSYWLALPVGLGAYALHRFVSRHQPASTAASA